MNYIDSYLQYLKEGKNISKNSLDSYRRDIKQYITYTKSINNTDYWQEKVAVFNYLHLLHKKGRATSTLHRKLVSLRAFFQYLLKQNIIKTDPTAEINMPKVEKKAPTILTVKEIESVLALPDTDTAMGIRDKAMIELLYASGLRVSELLALNLNDIDLTSNYIHCRNIGKERVVPINNTAVSALQQYEQERRKTFIVDDTEQAYFLNNKGQRLSRQGFWKIFKKYSENANINKEITPHTLRHSFASHLLASGANIHVVKEMMGHSDLSSTQAYKLESKPKLKDVYTIHHPRA